MDMNEKFKFYFFLGGGGEKGRVGGRGGLGGRVGGVRVDVNREVKFM